MSNLEKAFLIKNKLMKLDIQKFANISTHSTYWQMTNSNSPDNDGDCRPYFTFDYVQDKNTGVTTYTMNVYAQFYVNYEYSSMFTPSNYTISAVIAGETFTRSGTTSASGMGYTLQYLFSVSKSIPSNVDGTGIQIAYSIYGTCRSYLDYKYGATYYFIPPTVPLGATLNSISNFNVGEDVVVGANINNPNFTHTLNIKIGDVVVATRNITTTSTTISFTEEELNNIYNAMNLNSATFTFELITKNGNTQIGVASTRTATGTLTDVKPVIDSFEVSLNNPVSANNNIIKGVTNAIFTIFVTTKKNATISKLTINNINTDIVDEGNGIYRANLSITRATTGTFNLEVVDSRGNVANDKKEFTLIDYVPLSVGATFERASSTSGEISVNYSGNYWSGNFGGEDNTLNVSWKYREKGSSDWIDGTELTPTIDDTNMKFYQYTNLNNELGVDDDFFGYQKDWEFQIICNDKITPAQTQYPVVKGIGILEIYKTTALVNGDLEVSGNAKINKELCVGNIESKNLFDKNSGNVLEGFPDTSVNQLVYYSGAYTLYIPCKPNTTYTISKIVTSRFRVAYTIQKPALRVSFFNEKTNNEAEAITYTTGEDAKYLCVFFYHSAYDSSMTTQYVLDTVQIEKGSNATEYTEFKKYGYNESESMGSIVVEDITCKNMFNYNNSEYGYYGADGTDNTGSDASHVNRISDYINVDSDKEYTASANQELGYFIINEFDENKNWLKRTSLNNVSTNTITTSSTTKYIRVSFNIDNAVDMTITKLKEIEAQIEKGKVATKYVEHKEFSNKQIYSTNEQIVGTYADGRPLYRKTLFGSSVISNGSTMAHGVSNIGTHRIVKEAEFWYNNNMWGQTYNDANSFIFIEGIDANNIRFVIGGSWNDLFVPKVTIEYTKTTDVATIDVATINVLNNSSSYSLRNGDDNTNELY